MIPPRTPAAQCTSVSTARTNNPDEYWRSAPVTGHSVDNLAPAAPQNPLLASLGSNTSRLSWDRNRTDPDVGLYKVYRSTTNGFSVTDSTFLTGTPDTTVTDTPPSSVTYYYRITTADIHGNESTPTAQLSSSAMIGIAISAGWNLIPPTR